MLKAPLKFRVCSFHLSLNGMGNIRYKFFEEGVDWAMSCRTVYSIVASSTKNKVLENGVIRFMRSIDPATLDYETEENILNCFLTLEQAEKILKETGEDKKVSLIAFSIPVNCVLLHPVSRKGYSKRHMQRYVYERSGYRNYLTPVSDGNEKILYLVLADLSCIMGMYDPAVKGAGKAEACRQVVKERPRTEAKEKPRPEIKRTMQECVQARAAEPDDRGKWISFWAGLITGIILGLILAGGMAYYPFMTMIILSPAIAAVIYYYFFYRQK